MLSSAYRRQQIENLLGLLEKLELEPADSVRLETDLLIAYSLVQIEKHLEDRKVPEKEKALGK